MTKLSFAHISVRSCSSYEIDIEDKLRVKLHRQDFIDKIFDSYVEIIWLSELFLVFTKQNIYPATQTQ